MHIHIYVSVYVCICKYNNKYINVMNNFFELISLVLFKANSFFYISLLNVLTPFLVWLRKSLQFQHLWMFFVAFLHIFVGGDLCLHYFTQIHTCTTFEWLWADVDFTRNTCVFLFLFIIITVVHRWHGFTLLLFQHFFLFSVAGLYPFISCQINVLLFRISYKGASHFPENQRRVLFL